MAIDKDYLEAYELYMRGLDYSYEAGIEKNMIAARRTFEQAVELDPTFALAYAGLSEAARNHYWMGGGAEEAEQAAFAAAQRALTLAPDLPEAHMALGNYYYVHREYERAFGELRVAEQGLPSNAKLIRSKAYIMRRRGNWDESLKELMRARSLDPRDFQSALQVALTYACKRRYADARTYVERALALAPESPFGQCLLALTPVLRDGSAEAARAALPAIESIAADPWKDYFNWLILIYNRDYERAHEFTTLRERFKNQWHDYPASLLRGWTYRLQDRPDDAQREFRAALTVLEADVLVHPEDARLRSALGLAYAGLGQKSDALEAGRRAAELLPMDKDAFVGAWVLHDLGWNYTMIGEIDSAVETFDRVLSVPSFSSIESLQLDPRIEPLRNSERFRELVARHRRAD